MAARAPHLYTSLRGFALGAFVLLGRELEEGAELPVAFEEHLGRHGPALYEYRPLVRSFIEKREASLFALPDAALALEELRREPAAAIFARAHAGARLVIATAEACGGFDWDDSAFDRAYLELEGSLFGEHRAYTALAPVIGLSLGRGADLAEGLRVRLAEAGELARHWPEATGLLPLEFGREIDRLCVLELQRTLEAGEEPPDVPAELAGAADRRDAAAR
jgi:hypothetical protein